MQRYLQRLAAFQAPTSVDVAENTLRIFAGWMLGAGLDSVAAVRRDQIEDFKVWLANKPHPRGGTISPETHRQRLRMVRSFFERITEWDWPDASARNPVINGDIPKSPTRYRSSSRAGGDEIAGDVRHPGHQPPVPPRECGRAVTESCTPLPSPEASARSPRAVLPSAGGGAL